MKILTITLENLNSLRGKWKIDLTDRAYISDGIFAVTGRTGAGKTTIFDAVCLALYSQTPRLGKIEGNENEIMSKHTNECSASVKFEAGEKIYECEWTQYRAKGKLHTKHRIYADGMPINEAAGKRETISLVTKITGMDFKRFVHAMLLEQGAFDRFLNAKKDDKAEVLELITGTEIYSKISMEIYGRSKDEKRKSDLKKNELDSEKARFEGITEEKLEAEISQADDEISKAESERKSAENLLTWYKDIEALTQNLEQVRSDIEAHGRRAGLFKSERIILEAAERAEGLDGEYMVLCSKREAKIKAASEISGLSEKISYQEAESSRIADSLPSLSESLLRLRGGITENPQAVLNTIVSSVNLYVRQENDVKDAEKALDEAKKVLKKAMSLSSSAIKEGKSARSKLNEANDSYSKIFDEMKGMRARTASAVLDEERGKLVEGTPCPLCGSTVHPKKLSQSSSGENPDELFRKTEALEKEFERAKSAVDSAQRNFDNAVTQWNKASANESAASERVTQYTDKLSAMLEKLSIFHKAVSEAVTPLRISWDGNSENTLRTAVDWAEKVSNLEKSIQENESRKAVIEAGLSELRANFKARQLEFDSLASELAVLESSFIGKLNAKNFSDETEFLSARKDISKIETLKRKKDEIDSQAVRLQGILENAKKRLDDMKAANSTDQSQEEINARYLEEGARLKGLHERKGILTQKLSDVRKSAEKVKRLQNEYDSQKATSEDWSLLSDLVGSAQGDKFRVIAQKITLELVVANANKYLKEMRGRYTLVPTPDSQELELSVIDSEQAGEIRPTANLSGGERFIISLALALGLSQISGAKAKVDSLFIDEGFGSLDDDSLNAALEALGEIKREGRMIGIISHVLGISERISTKINVIRKNEGTSVLEGPGCFRIKKESKI